MEEKMKYETRYDYIGTPSEFDRIRQIMESQGYLVIPNKHTEHINGCLQIPDGNDEKLKALEEMVNDSRLSFKNTIIKVILSHGHYENVK
jgi:hypothetical protein